jgi:hypothetical protein
MTADLLTDAASGSRVSNGPSGPTMRQRLRANRGLLAIVLAVVIAALLIAFTQSRRSAGQFDPDAADPSGSQALATLLRGQGVTVIRDTTATKVADDLRQVEDATLLIAPTAPVSDAMLAAVRAANPRHVVLLNPDFEVLDAYAPWASESGAGVSTDEVAPGCTLDVALRAGPLPPTGLSYTVQGSGLESCWGGGVVSTRSDVAPGVTVVGLSRGFTNADLADSGYAAMALGVTGRSQTLVWWLPSIADPLQISLGEEPPSIYDLVPPWVGWALLQLTLAMGVVVWWRGRRLGRVVVEPLPVVVRATESVEGRARLYRRGRARGRAADALRTSALSRLRTRLSLPRSADVETVVAAVAVRTGRPAAEIQALLSPGTDPTDDVGLTRLANALDALENEVRHP